MSRIAPLFRHLYTWVLLAIILGALVGAFYPNPPLYVTSNGVVLEETHLAVRKAFGGEKRQSLSGSLQMAGLPPEVKRVLPENKSAEDIRDIDRAMGDGEIIYRISFNNQVGLALKPLGDGFIKLIRMVVAPIIFTTVVIGIAGMGNVKRAGRVGIKAILYFEAATTVALVIGWIVVKWIQPGVGVNADPAVLDTKAIQRYLPSEVHGHGVVEFLLNVIPGSIVDAFARGDIIQVLFFSLLFGFALSVMGARARPIVHLLEHLSEALMKIMGFIVKLAPLAAFGAIAYTTASFGIKSLGAQLHLMLCVYITCLVFIFLFLGTLLALNGVNILRFLKFIREELLIVLGTASSESVLPRMMTRLEQLGCSQPMVRLVLPTGYSFNMDGSCIYLTMAAIFIAQATNTHLTIWRELMVIAICLVTSKGAAGVVGSAYIVLAATLASLHTIPVAGMVLILGVDRLMAEARSITNLIGNGVATILVSKWEGEFNERTAREMLHATDLPSAAGPALVHAPDQLAARAAERLEDLQK
jgi:aerobic C4-dicarboxylate transport protein